jgi:hypothetical protein
LLALFCGAVAAATIFVLPDDFSDGRGYVVSTVGLAAIGFGLAALKRRNGGWPAITSAVGMALGAIGTALMLFSLVTFYSAPGHSLAANPPAPLELAPIAPATSATPAAAAPPVAQQDERAALAQTVGTIVYLLQQDKKAGYSGVPTALNAVSGRIVTITGSIALPPGSTVKYERSPDGTGYNLAVSGASGSVASYSTATGLVEISN